MSSIDVSAIAREVLKLMRSGDATDTPVATAPAPKRTGRKKSARSDTTAKPAAAAVVPKSVERFGRKLGRLFGGWFCPAGIKPESDQIVAQACFEADGKGTCNVRVFKDGWAQIEFPSLSSYRQNAIAVRPEVWQCVMHVMRSKTCAEMHEFVGKHGLRERA